MMETLSWVGFSQGMFAAILVLAKKDRSDSDRILAAWLSLLAIEFLLHAADYRIFGKPILSSSFLLFNPACYLYVRSLTIKDFRLRPVQLLHLLPYISVKLIAYLLREPYELEGYFEQDESLWFRILFSVTSVLSWVIYNSRSVMLVVRHRQGLKHEFSTIESREKVGWLLFVVVFYNLYCAVAIIIGATNVLAGSPSPVMHVYSYSTMLAMVYILGFYGLWQTSIYKVTDSGADHPVPYSRYPLSAKRRKQIRSELFAYFEREKPYLNPELNMSMISAHINIPKHHLTEVLNTEIGKNFFSFVNGYRVEEVKKQLIEKGDIYSIESIGFECGFSSKSTFFTVFKKITGQTPMQYKTKSGN